MTTLYTTLTGKRRYVTRRRMLAQLDPQGDTDGTAAETTVMAFERHLQYSGAPLPVDTFMRLNDRNG